MEGAAARDDLEPERPVGSGSRRRAIALTIGAIVGVATWCGLGAIDARARSQAHTIPTTPRTIAGIEIKDASARTVESVRQAMQRYVQGSFTLDIDGARRVVTRASLGARVDEERLLALVRQAATTTTSGSSHGDALPYPITIDRNSSQIAIVGLKDDLDRPASDARLDLDERKVIAEQVGVRVDVLGTLAAIDRAMSEGAPSAKVTTEAVAPTLAKEALGGVEMSDVLGYFETKYATDAKHVDRTFNLRLAASKLNGKVVMPGETFDFNEVVGPRDEAHGYRVAKVIADGELVDGMGGGTCQVAGTLHGAAFFSGIDITQRSPHTRPSFYIKMGLDAAVAYPSIDLKLRNPFTFPIVLRETVAGGTVRAEILGPKRTHTVTLVRKIDDILPFAERDVPDDRLPEGMRVLSQRGIPGFKVRRYRVVREGSNAVREKSIDTYPATTQIWRVGTGAAVTNAHPTADDHPEYVADELLTITQGPGVGKPDRVGSDAGMEESRNAGRTGVHGWSRHYGQGRVHAAPSDAQAEQDDDDKPKRKLVAKRRHRRP